ncbi:MAG TPA: hypothetical protein VJH92_05745 [Candidatus Nanoarchaeia archaeon]|nr:hypothetical protein [Candidatus Nanoarchaeia archaeon]
MDVGNLIFVLIVVIVVCIWVLWMAFVIANIIFQIIILKYLFRRNKFDGIHYFSDGLIWIIKNGFLFYTFRSDYYANFRKEYKYNEIKSKKHRDLIDKFGKISKVFLATFNILFVSIVGITFLSFIVNILFSAIK